MTITNYASNTTTADGSEQFLSSPNVVGEFALSLDLSNMAAGDVLEVRAYKMVLTGGTQRAFWLQVFYGAQQAVNLIALSGWIPNDLTDTNAVRFSIKQTFGTNRAYAWKVFNRDNGANVTFINGSAINSGGASGYMPSDNLKWLGGTIPAVTVTGVPKVDLADILGTAVSTPATAGILDVNTKNVNNVSASSVTTVNANQGTTQPTNFTGTGASALAKVDVTDIATAAVSTSTAQIGVNAVNLGGTVQTGRDIGASVLLSSGTGTGQLDFTSGVVKANLVQILGTVLTETAGLIAAGFKQFFNISSPTSTMNTITTVTTTATATTATNLTNAPTNGDFTAAMKTSLNAATPSVTVSDKTGFSLSALGIQAIWDALTSALTTVGSIGKLLVTNLDATISSRTKPADTQARVTLVDTATLTATATNLTNAPTSGDFTATMKTSLNNSTPTSVTTVTGNVNGNVTGSVGSVLGNVAGSVASVVGNVGGNVVGSVGSVVATVSANLAQILGTALTETTSGWLAAAFKKFFNLGSPTSTMNEITLVDTTTTLTNAVVSVTGAVGSVTGNVGGNVSGSVGSVAGNVVGSVASVTSPVTVGTNNDKTGYSLVTAPLTSTQTAQAVLNAVATSYDTSGTIGEQINNAGSAGDPLAQPVPGSYAVGTAGYDISLLTGINSRTQAAAINITSSDTNVLLNITQTVTYSAANGNRKQANVNVSTDPTGCTVTWAFLNGSSERTYTGSLVSYNSSTGIAVVAMDTFTATKADFPVGAPTILAQQAFSVALALPASAGNLVPVGFHSGKVLIQAAG